MNRTELVSAMAEQSGMTKTDSDKALKAFMEAVTEELKNGGKVQIPGFGTFEASRREEREGRNPATGESMIIPACTLPKFRAGKALKDAVN